jgi:hypothetical protein
MEARNYLAGKSGNPFNLPPPPAWWLRALADFDNALVVFPSVQRRAYILCRRRGYTKHGKFAPLLKLNNDLLRMTAGTDGDIMAQNNLVFVETIVGWGIWTNSIINNLRSRDTWAKVDGKSGGLAYAKRMEEAEGQARMKKLLDIQDSIKMRVNDAWRSRQARKGERNHHAKNSGRRVRGFADPASGSTTRTSRSSAGSGIVITG